MQEQLSAICSKFFFFFFKFIKLKNKCSRLLPCFFYLYKNRSLPSSLGKILFFPSIVLFYKESTHRRDACFARTHTHTIFHFGIYENFVNFYFSPHHNGLRLLLFVPIKKNKMKSPVRKERFMYIASILQIKCLNIRIHNSSWKIYVHIMYLANIYSYLSVHSRASVACYHTRTRRTPLGNIYCNNLTGVQRRL